MRKKLHLLFPILVLCFCIQDLHAQNPVRAKTEMGREVLLYPDGTWKYLEPEKSDAPAAAGFNRSPKAKTVFKPERGNFVLWYDETKWKVEKANADEKVTFHLIGTDGYAIILSEGFEIPTDALKQVALENAQKVAPDAQIVEEGNRVVNGRQILYMRIDGTTRGIPFSYYGYYYGGKEGAIQVITFTGRGLMDKYKSDFTSFLNGLEIQK